ncbi:hypothetical protein EXIGLDRAFT_761797 [Exidia glandulosa HHB12029]|uniref:Chitinase n=1 Tax=Exidia glandulosa HHB12029 TaxID=1314781 RepID=A0A165NAA8_EXIGL|nr:hypothetical protein EXIGLDRAFT_761797 [Exidia glandulosa HHB12029]
MALPEFFSDAVDMITSLSDDWDVVNLLWAEPTASPGVVALSTCRQEPCQSDPNGTMHNALISAVKRRVQSGRTVQICVNCLQGVPSSDFSILSLDSQDALDNFVQSVQDIVGGYGFNGVYIDVERANCSSTVQDSTGMHCINLANAIRRLVQTYGTSLSITLQLYGDRIGTNPDVGSLGVVSDLSDVVTSLYVFPPVSMISTTLPEAVDALFPGGGLPLRDNTSLQIDHLPVFFDVSASGSPGADAFWEDPSHVQAALSCITRNQSCAAGVKLGTSYPAFAGIVSRDIFDDETHGGAFRQAMVPYLKSLSQNLTTLPSTTSTDTEASTSTPLSTSTSLATSEQSHPISRTRALEIALPVGLVVSVAAVVIGFFLLRRRLGTRRRITAEAEVPHPYGVTSTQSERPIWREKLQRFGKTVSHHHTMTPSDPFVATSPSSDREADDTGLPQSATETGVAAATEEEADQPEQMAALRAAMRRVGFSVNALLASLNRIEPAPSPSASGDENSHNPSHSRSADVPPTYSED